MYRKSVKSTKNSSYKNKYRTSPKFYGSFISFFIIFESTKV